MSQDIPLLKETCGYNNFLKFENIKAPGTYRYVPLAKWQYYGKTGRYDWDLHTGDNVINPSIKISNVNGEIFTPVKVTNAIVLHFGSVGNGYTNIDAVTTKFPDDKKYNVIISQMQWNGSTYLGGRGYQRISVGERLLSPIKAYHGTDLIVTLLDVSGLSPSAEFNAHLFKPDGNANKGCQYIRLKFSYRDCAPGNGASVSKDDSWKPFWPSWKYCGSLSAEGSSTGTGWIWGDSDADLHLSKGNSLTMGKIIGIYPVSASSSGKQEFRLNERLTYARAGY